MNVSLRETGCLKKSLDGIFFSSCLRIMHISVHNRSATLFTATTKETNLVSWHLCTWVHFLARHEIRTNNYILLQFHFPKETNTRGSKAPTPFTPFHTNLQSFD